MDDIALVVLNYNSHILTSKLAEHLSSFGNDIHVIVVDNCSTDDSYNRLLEKFKDESNVDVIITDQNRGYSAGNNIGFKYAIDKYRVSTVGVLNPDVWIENRDLIDALHEKLYHNEKYAVIGGMPLNLENQLYAGACGWSIPTNKELILNFLINNHKLISSAQLDVIESGLAKVDCVVGCFFLIKVSVLIQIGFLNEDVFLYNEENLLGLRCKALGLIEVVAIDQFYHHNHKTYKEEPLQSKYRRMKAMYQSRRYLCEKYYPKYLKFFLAIANCCNYILSTLAYVKYCF